RRNRPRVCAIPSHPRRRSKGWGAPGRDAVCVACLHAGRSGQNRPATFSAFALPWKLYSSFQKMPFSKYGRGEGRIAGASQFFVRFSIKVKRFVSDRLTSEKNMVQ